MGLFGNSKPARAVVGKGARRHDRFPTDALTCVLGDVVDVSQSGLRVRSQGLRTASVGEVIHLAVASDRQRVSVSARVAWKRRIGFSRVELGLEFVNTPAGARAAIVQLARLGFVGGQSERLDPETTAAFPGSLAPPRIEVEDLYAVLGVNPNASESEIRAAYRAIARLCHPDVCQRPESAARFETATKAYAVLRDTDLRRRYDQLVARARAA